MGIYYDYFEYLLNIIHGRSFNTERYTSLLTLLFHTEFTWTIPNDENRANDGINLRRRFKNTYKISDSRFDELLNYFGGEDTCSVLEMMVGLANRCEEHIMENVDLGNRTSKWFMIMIDNLGLKGMTNSRFKEIYVRNTINRFLTRKYDKNGEGSLFVTSNKSIDMRKTEIWYQMSLYLDEVLDL